MLNKCYFSRFKNFEGLKQTNHLLRHIQTNNLFAVNIFFFFQTNCSLCVLTKHQKELVRLLPKIILPAMNL